jgi:hypothetical protein
MPRPNERYVVPSRQHAAAARPTRLSAAADEDRHSLLTNDPHRGTSGWSFCSRLTAIHADTGDAWAASI